MNPELVDRVDRYVRFFETLTPARLDALAELCDPDIRFKDPFNDGRGLPHIRRVFERMYADMQSPRFQVLDRALSAGGPVCYLRWRFTATHRRPIVIEGVSEIHFGDDGRVIAHIDHWDAAGQIYERLPLLGRLLRAIRRKLAA